MITGQVSQFQGGSGDRWGHEGVEPGLINVVKKGGEGEIILLSDGVILMIVTTGTLKTQPKESSAKGMDPVCHIFDSEFFGHTPAFDFLGVQPVKTGGKNLIPGRVGN